MKTGIMVSIILFLMSGLMLAAFASDTAKSTGLPASGQSSSYNLERDWLDTGSVRGKHPLILIRNSGFVYKCHGPVYRDWEAGIHGRLNGYWDTAQGVQTKLVCNQCHDPHQPIFQQLAPMAPPALSRFKNRLKGTEHE